MNTQNNFFNPIINFRSNLKKNIHQIGLSVGFNDPLLSESISDEVDFLWYDLEHVLFDNSAFNSHLLSCRFKKTMSFVRLGDFSAASIKNVLDAGANGIIAAQINSYEDAIKFSNNCRYPPLGNRGAGPRIPSNYRPIDQSYFEDANKYIFVCVMIETKKALDELDKILTIPNLDSIVIGPYDLSGAITKLGDIENTYFDKILTNIIQEAHNCNKYVGIGMPINLKFAKEMINKGVDWIQIGNDYEYLIKNVSNIYKGLKDFKN